MKKETKQKIMWGAATVLITAGLGITIFPDKVVPILCANKPMFGILIASIGGFTLTFKE